jgi:hypothetical protein
MKCYVLKFKIILLAAFFLNLVACTKENDVRDQYVGWYNLTSNYNYGDVIHFNEGNVLNIQKGDNPDELFFADATKSRQIVKLSGSNFTILPYETTVRVGDSEEDHPIKGEGSGSFIDGKLKFTKTIQMVGTDKKCSGTMTTSTRL